MTPRLIGNVLTHADTITILDGLLAARLPIVDRNPLGLNDAADLTNTVYISKRSYGLRYAYLQSEAILRLCDRVSARLEAETGLNWSTGINATCLPLFEYGEGVSIKPHRGRDIGYGANDMVAIAMVTFPGKDFAGGRFFLNPDAEPSEDGKTMLRENVEAREYIDIPYRGVYLFDNRKHVHGTEPVRAASTGQAQRITVSWRTAA